MFRKIKSMFGGGGDDSPPAGPQPPVSMRYEPYRDPGANFIYNLVFCDQPELFRPQAGTTPAPWQTAIFAARPDMRAIGNLAADPGAPARARMLAWTMLRAHGTNPTGHSLFGMIGEARL
ncbi:MAG: hypothetical protein FJX57_06735, partial [Alphaproteobacteria bacterium]|nr:hypothetical protein [Alphaproteobacteria bacterium]